VRFRPVLVSHLCGVAVSAVLPKHVGGVSKLVLARRAVPQLRYPALAASMLPASLLDLGVVGTLVLVLGPDAPRAMLPGLHILERHPVISAAALAAALPLACIAGRRRRARWKRLLREAWRGCSILRSPAIYLRQVAAWQAASWALRLGTVLCFLEAFHLQADLRVAALVILVQVASGAVAVAPSGVGVQQALLVAVLAGVAQPGLLLAFSVGMQAAVIGVDLLAGGAALAAYLLGFAGAEQPSPLGAALRRRPAAALD
jgi:hypothetical protein